MSEHLLHQILAELKEMNARFNAINKRFDGVNTRLDGMDVRFDGVDQRLHGMDARFDRLESELKEFREEMRTDLQILKGGQKGIRAEITDRFNEVKTETNGLSYKIDVLNREQLEMKADIEMLKSR